MKNIYLLFSFPGSKHEDIIPSSIYRKLITLYYFDQDHLLNW